MLSTAVDDAGWASTVLGTSFDTKTAAPVHVIGDHVSQAELRGLYAAADAFVLPSRCEQLPGHPDDGCVALCVEWASSCEQIMFYKQLVQTPERTMLQRRGVGEAACGGNEHGSSRCADSQAACSYCTRGGKVVPQFALKEIRCMLQ